MHATVIVLVALLGITVGGVNFDGYQLYKVMAKTESDNQYLLSLEEKSNHFDFWSHINKIGDPVLVMVSPEAQRDFQENLKINNIEFEVQIENVEKVIQAERQHQRSLKPLQAGHVDFNRYLRHDEINNYLAELSNNYNTVTLEDIGKSYQGRDLQLIRISSGPSDPPKPVIFVDAGIHAREWIAPATALYLINQLVEVPDNSDLVAEVDWIVLPSLNPDGYEHTHESNRLWRKTLSKGIQCDGSDANRNFGYFWLEAGASAWECSDIYAGSQPFSEPEAQRLRDYILKTDDIVAYFSLHSYGQLLLYPWGYENVSADNFAELDEVGARMNDAISAVRGTTYSVGRSTALLYAAAGNSVDWSMGEGKIDIAFTMELNAGNNSTSGFIVPPDDIQAIVEETFEGFKALGEYIANNRP